jgi:carnitine O-acetyltransferase
MIKNASLQFNIASVRGLQVGNTVYANGTHQFKHYLEEAANDLRDLLITELPVEPKL